jgi:hypothetical protein
MAPLGNTNEFLNDEHFSAGGKTRYSHAAFRVFAPDASFLWASSNFHWQMNQQINTIETMTEKGDNG